MWLARNRKLITKQEIEPEPSPVDEALIVSKYQSSASFYDADVPNMDLSMDEKKDKDE